VEWQGVKYTVGDFVYVEPRLDIHPLLQPLELRMMLVCVNVLVCVYRRLVCVIVNVLHTERLVCYSQCTGMCVYRRLVCVIVNVPVCVCTERLGYVIVNVPVCIQRGWYVL
jgi:hypothetical protein